GLSSTDLCASVAKSRIFVKLYSTKRLSAALLGMLVVRNSPNISGKSVKISILSAICQLSVVSYQLQRTTDNGQLTRHAWGAGAASFFGSSLGTSAAGFFSTPPPSLGASGAAFGFPGLGRRS